MKLYVVNLDSSKDRMAWFDRQTAGQPLDFVRVPAVDGSKISEAELLHYHTLCPITRSISFGELGCFLSHVQIWKRIAAGSDQWAFIGEDDLHLGRDAEWFLSRDDWMPAGVDLVKAETMLTTVEMSSATLGAANGHDLRLLHSFHGGSAGYFLSRAGAARLLDLAEIHCEPVDHFIFGSSGRSQAGLSIAQIDPAICIQDDQLANKVGLASDLDDERAEFLNRHPLSRKPRGARKLLRELRRAAGYVGVPIRRMALRAAGRRVFRRVPVTLADGTLVTRQTRKARRPPLHRPSA